VPNLVAVGQTIWASVGVPKYGDAGPTSLKLGCVSNLEKHAPPPTYGEERVSLHRTKFGRSRPNRISVNKGPKNLRDAGPSPLISGEGPASLKFLGGRVMTSRNILHQKLPTPNLVVLGQTVGAHYGDPPEKN